MKTRSEFRFSRFASAAAIAAATTLAACGGSDRSGGATTETCTLALHTSTDDAHLQAAIESALQRPNPCNLPDASLRDFMVFEGHASAGGTRQLADAWYRLPIFYFSNTLRIERDDQSVRAVFQAVPETRFAEAGE